MHISFNLNKDFSLHKGMTELRHSVYPCHEILLHLCLALLET